MIEDRRCRHCNSMFTPMHSERWHCSYACEDAELNKRPAHKLKSMYTILKTGTCQTCGEEYQKNAGNQKFCSTNCRSADERARKYSLNPKETTQ